MLQPYQILLQANSCCHYHIYFMGFTLHQCRQLITIAIRAINTTSLNLILDCSLQAYSLGAPSQITYPWAILYSLHCLSIGNFLPHSNSSLSQSTSYPQPYGCPTPFIDVNYRLLMIELMLALNVYTYRLRYGFGNIRNASFISAKIIQG